MNKKNIPAEMYSLIRSRILSFKLLPGVKVSDKDIAKEFGTSRTPVREALIRLADHGLVTALHNKGFTVRQFSIKDVEDIYILREALEILAVKLTIKNYDKTLINKITKHVDTYPDLIASRNRNGFNKADEEFHLLIAQGSDNQSLIEQLNTLHDQLAVLRRYAHLLSNDPTEAYETETYTQHRQILNCIVKKDVQTAATLMSEHIFDSMDSVLDAMKQNLEG